LWNHFCATGKGAVPWIADHLRAIGVPVQLDSALDFGCGYGRLTQALAQHFGAATRVDIAPTMLEGARKWNRRGGRCRYLLNETGDLRQFADRTFDFVLSLLVLQHMRPDYATAYLRELLRVLRPGGVAFFQAPTEPLLGRCCPPPRPYGPRRRPSSACRCPHSPPPCRSTPIATSLPLPNGSTTGLGSCTAATASGARVRAPSACSSPRGGSAPTAPPRAACRPATCRAICCPTTSASSPCPSVRRTRRVRTGSRST
jgi:hypothetical protein